MSFKTKESLLRLPSVTARTGLARSTLYKLVAMGVFPKPYSLVGRTVAWRESEVDAWIGSRIAAGSAVSQEGV